MHFRNYKKASDYHVAEWLYKSIPEITAYQKQKIRDNEIIRFAPFEFIEQRKKVSSIWLRFTIILMPIVWLLIVISLPFRFLITGRWGYSYKNLQWYDKWSCSIGL